MIMFNNSKCLLLPRAVQTNIYQDKEIFKKEKYFEMEIKDKQFNLLGVMEGAYINKPFNSEIIGQLRLNSQQEEG